MMILYSFVLLVNFFGFTLPAPQRGLPSDMQAQSQKSKFNQHGEVTGQGGNSRALQINAGVRQGCVLSPKMFSSVMACHLFWI